MQTFETAPAAAGLLPRRVLSGAAVLTLAALLATGCGDSNSGSTTPPSTPAAGSAASAQPAGATPAPASAPIALPSNKPEDIAWAAFEEKISTPPSPPASWAGRRPSEEEIEAFKKSTSEAAAGVAASARDFYTKYPKDERAEAARFQELQLLNAAYGLGNTNVLVELEKLEKARLDDTAASPDERFSIEMTQAERAARQLMANGGSEDAARASMIKSASALAEKYPDRAEPYQILLGMAGDLPAAEARATVDKIVAGKAPEPVKEAAKSLLTRLDMVGKPLDLKFTTVDGKEISLESLRGKVVLVDFWATWCGPCIAELPNVKAAYEKLHPKGFEILGISFDEDKEELLKFVAQEKMTWPQYFDGKGWGNEIGKRFGIASIPAMWLVDKKGVLRDLNARDGLAERVEKLLAENGSAAGAP